MALLGTTLAFAATNPLPPTEIVEGPTSSFDVANYGSMPVNATAGNITQLIISGIGQTKAWQGYYGNITGSITLDDANNFTFYNWSSAEPQGQIYATLTTTVAWLSVDCLDYADVTVNEAYVEGYYGINSNHVDGIAETFNQTDHPLFQVGSTTMTACPTTYIFQNDEPQQANFVNVLLWDTTNTVDGWIYTTLIENKSVNSTNDLVCYNGEECDFQILVNENGHGTDTSPTTYYFWVELL